jgi:hypothetical protein
MSDLQCAARFVLVCAPDAATAESLRYERVAAVYDGPPGSGAARLGDALGLPVQVLARPLAVDDVLAQAPEALGDLRELADLHRGETVVITAVGRPGRRLDVAVDGDGVTMDEISPGAAR